MVGALNDQWFKQEASVNSGNRKVIANATAVLGGWIVRVLLIICAAIKMIVRRLILSGIEAYFGMFIGCVALVLASGVVVISVIRMRNRVQ